MLVGELGDRTPGPAAEVDLTPARVTRRVGVAEQRGGLARADQIARDDLLETGQKGAQRRGFGAPDIGERRVGLALQMATGVVGRLAVADQDKAG